jgi:acetyltransferase
MKALFYPSSVVVFGVSTVPRNLGKEIARNLLEFGYDGVIHLVGIEGGTMLGRKIHKDLDEITDPIDLAIILTPAKTVPAILEKCAQKGITRAVIESGGFGEYSDTGQHLGAQLTDIARRHNIRFVGPNCIGLMNSSNGFVTPFARLRNVFRKGGVGIVAQSGGVALTFLNMFDSEQLGYSKFASIGNKINVDENDVVEYLTEDPETNIICLYVESMNNGRRLSEIGRRSSKPIVVHKANIGPLSAAVAQSHTEALANDDQVVDAALHQSGIVRLRDMQSFLDFVKVFELPVMHGRRLAIISRSGGHAVIAADAAFTYGFELPPLGQELLQEIRSQVRANVIKLANPLDLGDLFDFEVYVKIVRRTLEQEGVDGVLMLITYFAAVEGEASRKLLRSVAALSREYHKPVALCVTTEPFEISRLHQEFDFPFFMSPDRAVRALDSAIRYSQRRSFVRAEHTPAVPTPVPDRSTISQCLTHCREEKRSPSLDEALNIITSSGFTTPPMKLIRQLDDLPNVPLHFDGPYAIKVVSRHLSHKSDKGGVMLDLVNLDALRDACSSMFERFGVDKQPDSPALLIQKMVPRRVDSYELIVGGKRDHSFGPMVLLGHGGLFVEIFAKVILRMAPLSLAEIDEMIDELPGSEIFFGVRGRSPIDRAALRDAIIRVADLMINFDQIQSIDINPLIVSPEGATAVDARIFLGD